MMSSNTQEEVSRHFSELSSSLRLTPVLKDENVSRVLHGLEAALHSDGFDVKGASDATAVSGPKTVAFRVFDAMDASIVEGFVSLLEGWKFRSLAHKSAHFVVISNVPRLTEKRVKKAVRDCILSGRGDKDTQESSK